MPTLNGMGERTVEAKTAAYTIVAATDVGKVFTNAAASGAIVFQLPAATVGQWYDFTVKATQELRIEPTGSETIALASGAQQAAGVYITADAIGEMIRLTCVKTGEWDCHGSIGTWGAGS